MILKYLNPKQWVLVCVCALFIGFQVYLDLKIPDYMNAMTDAILDGILKEDPAARVAVETVVTTGIAIVVGEITSTATPNVQKIVREVVKDIGYTGSEMGFDADTCSVMVSLDEQSPDIAMGVNQSTDSASGDKYERT